MRGDRIDEALAMRPVRASPEDSPRVRLGLRGGVAGVTVRMERADTYNFWRKTKVSPQTTLLMSPPVVRVYAQRGKPLPHVVAVPAPVTVGTEEQVARIMQRRELLDSARQRGKP